MEQNDERINKQTDLFIDSKTRFEAYLMIKYGGYIENAKGLDRAVLLLMQHIAADHNYGRDKPDY